MSGWIISIIDGVFTGTILYGLVRLRIYLGPVAGRKLGVWGRRAVWVLLIAVMVILAEIDLLWLRHRLQESNAGGTHLYYEIVYAATLLSVGLGLVRWRTLRRPLQCGDQPNTQRYGQKSDLRRNQ